MISLPFFLTQGKSTEKSMTCNRNGRGSASSGWIQFGVLGHQTPSPFALSTIKLAPRAFTIDGKIYRIKAELDALLGDDAMAWMIEDCRQYVEGCP
jgi:hypothetical protein